MDTRTEPTKRRTRRTMRRLRVAPYRAKERDAWILDALAKMRFLTTTLIATLFFGGSRSAANKGLRRLFDAGLIRTWVRDLAKDNVYALTPTGRDALGDSADPLGTARACPRRLDGQLEHLLSLNAVRVAFATGLADAVIAWWRSDWELRGFARSEAVPDARFALRWPDSGEQVFVLEVEYHTRSPRKFLRKILRYTANRYRPFGSGGDDIILVVGRHPAWLERYRVALASLAPGHGVWFTTFVELEQHGADGTIWRATAGEDRVSLHDFTNRPYGTAGSHTENGAASRPSASRAAHICPPEHTPEASKWT